MSVEALTMSAQAAKPTEGPCRERHVLSVVMEEAWGEAAAVEGGPEAVAGAAEVAADGGRVEAGVDAGEEDDEVFGDEIRDLLVARGEELGFGRFPGGR